MRFLKTRPGRRWVWTAVGLAVAAVAVTAWLPGGLELRVVRLAGGAPLLVDRKSVV